jgi:hypothetical protein
MTLASRIWVLVTSVGSEENHLFFVVGEVGHEGVLHYFQRLVVVEAVGIVGFVPCRGFNQKCFGHFFVYLSIIPGLQFALIVEWVAGGPVIYGAKLKPLRLLQICWEIIRFW